MTVSIILRDAPKKDGTFPICIQVIENRKPKYYRTGYSVQKNQFKNGLVVKHTDAIFLNNQIEKKRQEYLKGLENESGLTMFEAITKMLDNYEAKNMAASFNRMLTNKRMLLDAWGKDKPIQSINKADVEKYIQYRYSQGNGDNTVRKNLQDLSTVLTFVDFTGKNYFKAAIKGIKVSPVNKNKLSAGEIEKLELVPLDGLLGLARDIFLFSYYCHGMRFGDAVTIEMSAIKEGVISYQMGKSKDIREIEIHPKLSAIIAKYGHGKYLFPLITKDFDVWSKKEVIGSANTLMNTYLKRVAIISGIETKISMHIARHSFANNAKKKGINPIILKDALGHSSFAMTEKYLKSLSDDEINEGLRGLW